MCTLYESIISLCNERGIKGGKMCVDLGLSKSLLSDLKAGRKKRITSETAQKIADYFSVSVDRVLHGEQKEKPSAVSSEGFSDSDIKLLEWFRSLPEEKRRAILIASDAPEDVL